MSQQSQSSASTVENLSPLHKEAYWGHALHPWNSGKWNQQSQSAVG